MRQETHLEISRRWVGRVEALAPGRCRASLETEAEMAADDRGLVHGGFPFGLADFAAMVAVNDPNVVLGAADVRFTAPVRVGETLTAEATVEAARGRKREVRVEVRAGERTVLEGTLTAFVLDRHVLDGPR